MFVVPNSMYIRVKKRSKNDANPKFYAYLVSSKRRYKKPVQKTLKYLGKVLDLSSHNTTQYNIINKEEYIQETRYDQIIKDLLKNELIQTGFQNIKSSLFLKDDYMIDLSTFTFQTISKKQFVIKINDGFLCKHTIKSLINLKFENKTQKECIKLFTNKLISTGINIDKELFILLFKKIYLYKN